MTYIINYTNDSKSPIIVRDKELNEITSIKLVGKNYPGYGEIIAENFLHLLEHFANSNPPENPKEGQIWYNPNNEIVSVYTASNEWKSLGNVSINSTNPLSGSSSSPGHIWINTVTNSVFVYTGISWLQIAIFNEGNGLVLRNRFDTQNNPHSVLELYINFEIIAIISSDTETWVPQNTGPNTEFIFSSGVRLRDHYPFIKNGINLNFLKNHGISSDGIIEADVLKANKTEGAWIASQQDITNIQNLSNDKIMTPFSTNQLLLDRISRDNAYRATLDQAIRKVEPIVNDKLMTPFLTRRAYENYVDDKITFDIYQRTQQPVLITAQDTWQSINAQIVNVFANKPVIYSYNVILLATNVTMLGFRLYDNTNNVETNFSIFNYPTAQTGNIHTSIGENYSYILTTNQTIELQLQAKMVGDSVEARSSHTIMVTSPFE